MGVDNLDKQADAMRDLMEDNIKSLEELLEYVRREAEWLFNE